MPKKSVPPDSRHPRNQIRDFIDDEKSLGRAKKGQIAAAIGIRPSHFSNLLNGRNEWKLTHLQKLAEFLEVPLARLFEDRGRQAETGSLGEADPASVEENIVRNLRAEAQSLRSALREDVAALLREHGADRRPSMGEDPGSEAPTLYTDDPADRSVARPVQIGELDALYDRPPADPLTAPDSLWFGRDWLRREGLDSSRCLVIRVQDESMEPSIPGGCWVLINRAQRRRREGRIYALRTAQGFIVRRAARDRARGWLLESDHPDREAVAWPDDAEIIGEVRWMARTF